MITISAVQSSIRYYSLWNFAHIHPNKAHSLIGKKYLAIIASNNLPLVGIIKVRALSARPISISFEFVNAGRESSVY